MTCQKFNLPQKRVLVNQVVFKRSTVSDIPLFIAWIAITEEDKKRERLIILVVKDIIDSSSTGEDFNSENVHHCTNAHAFGHIFEPALNRLYNKSVGDDKKIFHDIIQDVQKEVRVFVFYMIYFT